MSYINIFWAGGLVMIKFDLLFLRANFNDDALKILM